jgi:hypothetical protein
MSPAPDATDDGEHDADDREDSRPIEDENESKSGDGEEVPRSFRDDGGVELSDDHVGGHVVGEDGRAVGVVRSVDAEAGRLRVEPDPDLADGLKAKLGWTEPDGDGRRIDAAAVERVEGDRVVVGSSVAAAATPDEGDGTDGGDSGEGADDDSGGADGEGSADDFGGRAGSSE